MTGGFEGFAPELPAFLAELERNNNREWFNQNRKTYERVFLEAAKDFVVAIAPALARIAPAVHAEPRVGGSLLRTARDIRFSKDKRPYKTTLDLMFWEGDGPNREAPCFFMRITPTTLAIGGGMHGFTPAQLNAYREAVANPKRGAALDQAIRAVTADGRYQLGEQHYKRVPRGFAADHPRADLLRHNALYASTSEPLPDALFGPTAIDHCARHFTAVRPIQAWLVQAFSEL